MTTQVSCRRDGDIVTVQLDRPDKLNGVTLPMLDELVRIAHRLGRDRRLRAVLLCGAGEAFCAGLDIPSALRDPTGVAMRFVPNPLRGTNTFQEACWAWRRLAVPVIAAVHGHCYGAGLQLALSADQRITTADASWSVMEIRWGLVPDLTGTRTLPRLVGPSAAKRLAWTGERITGTQAVALGLADAVAADPLAAAAKLAAQAAERPRSAIAAAKRLLDDGTGLGVRRAFARERREQLRLLPRVFSAARTEQAQTEQAQTEQAQTEQARTQHSQRARTI